MIGGKIKNEKNNFSQKTALEKKQILPSSKKSPAIYPAVIFVVFLIISIFIWYLSENFIKQSKKKDFEVETTRIGELIEDRLEIYTNTLYGGRGLFNSSEKITREEWHTYVESLEIQKNYPGIQGFGYSVWLEPGQLSEHISLIRSEGFPEYSVHPSDPRPYYTAIVYLEPFDLRNQQAFGFDMYQEPIRRKAMDTARDTGDAAMSGKVTLVQEIDEDVQAGFLIYVPVYKKELINAPEDRRKNLLGFVYSPFRMNNFIDGALAHETKISSNQISIKIYDTESVEDNNEERKMYDNKTVITETLFSKFIQINFANHTWTIEILASKDYESNILNTTIPIILLIVTVIFGTLISFLIYIINTRKIAAISLAESMTEDLNTRTQENETFRKKLQENNNELKKKTIELSKKIKEVEEINKHMVNRELKMMELKKQVEQTKNKGKKI